MTGLPDRFEPNSLEVAAEVVDGEAILINLSTGTYYSMAQTASMVWSLIEQRRSIADIVTTLSTIYAIRPEQARADVEQLIDQLCAEQLVIPAASAGSDQATFPQVADHPYEVPRLEIFRDLSAMFALDPPMPRLLDVSL